MFPELNSIGLNEPMIPTLEDAAWRGFQLKRAYSIQLEMLLLNVDLVLM